MITNTYKLQCTFIVAVTQILNSSYISFAVVHVPIILKVNNNTSK